MTSSDFSLQQFIEAGDQVGDQAEKVVIFFADLVGSTEYKMDRMAAEGLRKTVLHNAAVCEAIAANHGEVVKMLGDGVLGVFRESTMVDDSLDAGLSAIEAIERCNKKNKWNVDDPAILETRIGIHVGEVWWLTFPQSTVPDPQGSTVDTAFRIQGLANPQTIACSEKLFELADNHKARNATECEIRVLKGIRAPVKVRLVCPMGVKLADVPLSPNCIPTHKDFKSDLKIADEYYRERNYDEAEKIYRKVLKKLPTDYRANFRLAKILIRRKTTSPTDIRDSLREARERLCMTKRLVSDDGRIWTLLGWVRFKAFENSVTLTDKQEGREYNLNKAIENTRQAITRAIERSAHDKLAQARSQLALFLAKRSKEEFGKGQADLDDAHTESAAVEVFPALQLERVRSECTRIRAVIKIELLSKVLASLPDGDDGSAYKSDVARIDELLLKAERADGINPEVDLARGLLKERLRDLGFEHLMDGKDD